MKINLSSIDSCIPVANIKDNILKNINKQIKVREYKNKKLTVEYLGQILEIHSNIFIVRVNYKNLLQNKSFSYRDISIGIVEYEIVE